MGVTHLDLSYHPTIWKFMQDDSPVRVVVGPVGSGKSTGVGCGEIMRRAFMQAPSPLDNIRYFKALVVRNTQPELRKTTLKTWLGMYPESLGKFNNTALTHHITVPAGKDGTPGLDLLVEFMGLDGPQDAAKLLSWEGTLIWFNEAKEIDKTIVDQADGRVGRYPSMKQGGVMPSWYGIIMDTNPFNSGHWMDVLEKNTPDTWGMYRQPPGVLEMEKVNGGWRSVEPGIELSISEDTPEYIHEGGGLQWAVNPNAENLRYLPINFTLDPFFVPGTGQEDDEEWCELARRRRGGYYGNIVKGKELSYIQIFVQGKNGALTSDHAVIPEFDRKTMVTQAAEYNPTMPLHMGIDFGAGTLNPAAVIGQMDPIEGRWVILKEVVCQNMGLIDFVAQIKRTLNENFPGHSDLRIWGDPAGLQRDGVSMKTYFDHLASEGLYARSAPSNIIDIRIECIRAPMKRFTRGKPGILFSPDCFVLIEALEEKWNYKRLKVAGEIRYDDKPCKDHPASDVCDALGYLLSGGGEHYTLISRNAETMGGGSGAYVMDTSWDVI